MSVKDKMEGLSDDLLLSVFLHLDVKDLLRVRGVCSRWRSLALHWSLWRRLSVHDLLVGKKLCQAVLSLVPCLDRLSLNLDHPFPLLVTTKCAVKKLKVSVRDDRATLTMRVLRQQLELGSLRELDVNLLGQSCVFASLMGEICLARNLLKLTMLNYRPPIGGDVQTHTTPASLQEIYWDASLMDRHLQFLLYSHRRTLQVVSAPYCVGLPRHIMQSMKALRRLECPPQEDMTALAQCPALTALTIHMVPDYQVREVDAPRVLAAVAGTVEFLSVATQLKQFKLHPWESVEDRNLIKELLLAPSSLRDSALDEIELALHCPIATPQQSLAKALPHMTALRRITLSCQASLKLLAAITPQNAPRLSELSMVLSHCAHRYIHLPEVRRLLDRNARLHLLLTDMNHCNRSNPCSPACRLPCHAALVDPARTSSVGVFGHPEYEPCLVAVHRGKRNPYLWVRI